MTGPRSEGVKVDRERRIRRVPKGEDYLYTESGAGPALAPFCAVFGASYAAREKNAPGSARMLKFSSLSPDLQPVGRQSRTCSIHLCCQRLEQVHSTISR